MFRFQLAQSFGVVSIWFVAWLLGLWLFGRIPFLPQVAYANDVQSSSQQLTQQVARIARENSRITAQLNTIQLLQIRSGIETQLKYLCQAKRSHNQADLDNANQQLNTLNDTYYSIAGRSFALPSCDTILIGGK
jgi:hypothetical protein